LPFNGRILPGSDVRSKSTPRFAIGFCPADVDLDAERAGQVGGQMVRPFGSLPSSSLAEATPNAGDGFSDINLETEVKQQRHEGAKLGKKELCRKRSARWLYPQDEPGLLI
jgi:hypothetical protein